MILLIDNYDSFSYNVYQLVTLQNSFCKCCRRLGSINSRNEISATFLLPCFSFKYSGNTPFLGTRTNIFYHVTGNSYKILFYIFCHIRYIA
jgi:hypothetical protein